MSAKKKIRGHGGITVAILAGALICSLAPAPARAQGIDVTGACSPASASCNVLRFFLTPSSPVPASVFTLMLTIAGSPQAHFTATAGDALTAQDAFGPFPGASATSASATSVFVQFADPTDLGAVAFAVNSFAFGPMFVDVPGTATGNSTFSFTAQVPDMMGTIQSVTGTSAALTGATASVGVTPEPRTVLLLLSGLLGLGAVGLQRRRSATSLEA